MNKRLIIGAHIVFWLIIIFIPNLLVLFSRRQVPTINLVYSFSSMFLHLTVFYIFYLTVNLRLLNKKYAFKQTLVFLLMILGLTAFRIGFIYLVYRYGLHLQNIQIQTQHIVQEFINSFVFAIIAIFFKLSIDWFNTQRLKTELILQNQSSELALLRTQINPHFLFNTLNNIYSLVYQKSDDAPKAVMKLSEIMRYMLYDSNTDKVLLENEVSYLKSFIELQELRLKQKDFIQFNISGDISVVVVSPMILIPFVENAFKHGNKKVNSPGIIINLRVEKSNLFFEVINECRMIEVLNKDKTGGIGLQNIKRRLELLYPNKHELIIKKEKEKFKIKMQIEL